MNADDDPEEDQSRAQSRALALMVLLALWLAAWGYSLVFLLTVAPEGDGFTRGLNRVSGFLGWQGVAGLLAFASWGIGLSFDKGSGIRRVSAVPLGMALAVVLLVLGWVLLRAS